MNAVYSVDGRVIGRRGRATRERLLQELELLLARTPVADLLVVDVAFKARVSPATFYQYFRTLDDAVAALEKSDGFCSRVHTYRPRAGAVRAVRWDGQNAEAVENLTGQPFRVLAAHERDACKDPEATAELTVGGQAVSVRTGWWIVRSEEDGVQILPDREFRALYWISGAEGP